jgi:hypothetical protein
MPRCADPGCGRWRPERLAPKWASGIRFNSRWYCSRDCVEHAARAGLDVPAVPAAPVATLPPLRLGVLLRHMGAITEQQLASALEAQRKTGRKLGAELRARNIITAEQMLKALAAQANVSYLASFELTRVMRGPVWLSAQTVRALGLVPFELDEVSHRVRVACTAPVPRAAIRALLKLTGWTVDPYLVDDAVWMQALRVYRPADAGVQTRRETVSIRGVAAAAARVADAAVADRAITMRHAEYDRFTWVRVEGPHLVSDLLVTGAEEDACQVERIAR